MMNQVVDMLISLGEVAALTGLSGFRLFKHQVRKKEIVNLVQKVARPGSSVLDVGCAGGDIAIELANLGLKVHGIDFEPLRLAKAKTLAQFDLHSASQDIDNRQ